MSQTEKATMRGNAPKTGINPELIVVLRRRFWFISSLIVYSLDFRLIVVIVGNPIKIKSNQITGF